MPMIATYIAEEQRLDLTFEGNLDVSVSQDVCDTCRAVSSDLRSCIIDLSGVERLFDSGIALLRMLYRRLSHVGVTVVILSDLPELQEYLPLISGDVSRPPSVRS
jgi:ABC-type transporter Mla MlaB component